MNGDGSALVLTSYLLGLRARAPISLADALQQLARPENAHKARDNVVEAFRAMLVYAAGIALAARIHREPPEAEPRLVAQLLGSMRRGQPLSDGGWRDLARETLRPWARRVAEHPVPPLVDAFHGAGRGAMNEVTDRLLAMRKRETVAHGTTGTEQQLWPELPKWLSDLEAFCRLFEPMFDELRLVAIRGPAIGGAMTVNLLAGYTPHGGEWPLQSIAACDLAIDTPLLVDAAGAARLALSPIMQFARAPGTPRRDPARLYILRQSAARGTVFEALPSMETIEIASDVWRHLGLVDESPIESDGEPARPYRGLQSFEGDHAALFFGRDELAVSVANRVRREPLVTLTGASGSGKTSLIRAGVAPRLDGWRVAAVRPGADPLRSLCRALALDADVTERSRTPEIVDAIAARSYDDRLLVVVDQCEELFTLCSDEHRRLSFASALDELINRRAPATHVLLSIRADFVFRLSELPGLGARYIAAMEHVSTPDAGALRSMLVEPLATFGFEFEDDELVTAIVNDVRDHASALPLLQFCADRMWDLRDRGLGKLTWHSYRAMGGVAGALAAHASATFKRFSAFHRDLARKIVVRLVTPDGTRARVSRGELLSAFTERHGDVARVLDHLINARLLVAHDEDDAADDEASVELTHESLIEEWPQLRTWLDQDREVLRAHAYVAQRARRWREHGGDDLLYGPGRELDAARELLDSHPDLVELERPFIEASKRKAARGRRVRRLLVGGVIGLALVAMVGGSIAMWQARLARRAKSMAAEQASEARRRLARTYRDQGLAALFSGRPRQAAVYLSAGYEGGVAGDELRIGLADAMTAVEAPTTRLTLPADKERARNPFTYRYDATEAMFAATGRVIVTGIEPIALWSRDGRFVRQLPLDAYHARCFDSTGTVIATVRADGRVTLWNAETGEALETYEPERPLPEGGPLMVGFAANDRIVYVHDEESQRLVAWNRITGSMTSLDDVRGVSEAAFVARDGDLFPGQLRSLVDGSVIAVIQGYSSRFSLDGAYLLIDNAEGTSVIVPSDGRVLTSVRARQGCTAVAVSIDHSGGAARAWRTLEECPGNLLLRDPESDVDLQWFPLTGVVAFDWERRLLGVTNTAGVTWVIRLANGSVEYVLDGTPDDAGTYLAFDPQGEVVLTSGASGSRLWSVPRSQVESAWTYAAEMARHSDGLVLASSVHDFEVVLITPRTAQLWDAATGTLIAEAGTLIDGTAFGGERAEVAHVSPGHDLVAVGTTAGGVYAWRPDAGRDATKMDGPGGPITAVATNAAGTELAVGTLEGRVRYWPGGAGAASVDLGEPGEPVSALAFSYDGSQLLVGRRGESVELWELQPPRYIEGFADSASKVRDVIVTPDGNWLIISGRGTVELRAGATGRVLRRFDDTPDIMSWALSPDGRLLATVGRGQTVQLHDISTGMRWSTAGPVWDWRPELVFSESGSFLAAGPNIYETREAHLIALRPGTVLSFLAGDEAVLTAAHGTAQVQALRRESRPPEIVRDIVGRRVPWSLVDGRLVAKQPSRSEEAALRRETERGRRR